MADECDLCGGTQEIEMFERGPVPCPSCIGREYDGMIEAKDARIAELERALANERERPLTEEELEEAQRAHAEELGRTETCDKCKGTGVESCGDSQDWCSFCGGCGWVGVGSDADAMRKAIEALQRFRSQKDRG